MLCKYRQPEPSLAFGLTNTKASPPISLIVRHTWLCKPPNKPKVSCAAFSARQ